MPIVYIISPNPPKTPHINHFSQISVFRRLRTGTNTNLFFSFWKNEHTCTDSSWPVNLGNIHMNVKCASLLWNPDLISSCLLEIPSLMSVISNLTWSDLRPQTHNLLLPLSSFSQRMTSRASSLLRFATLQSSFVPVFLLHALWKPDRKDPLPHLLLLSPSLPLLQTLAYLLLSRHTRHVLALGPFDFLSLQPDTQIPQTFLRCLLG